VTTPRFELDETERSEVSAQFEFGRSHSHVLLDRFAPSRADIG